jgi:hypothetical protein
VTKANIVEAIINRAGGSYTDWRIGITNDPVERKQVWAKTEDVSAWEQWPANSLEDARAIENYFIQNKEMDGGVGGSASDDTTVYVYIF